MNPIHPRYFLDDQFPVSIRQRIPTLLENSYEAVRRTILTEPWMQIESMDQDVSRLMAKAVDYSLVRAIENGTLPFDYSWEDYAKPTGKYLCIRLSHSTLTASLSKNPDVQPRSVRFREQLKELNNQLDWIDMLDTEREIQGLPNILMLHGHWNDGFAYLGIPRSDCSKDFSYRTENLFNLPREVVPEGPDPEGPDDAYDFEAIELLKEDLDRWRRD